MLRFSCLSSHKSLLLAFAVSCYVVAVLLAFLSRGTANSVPVLVATPPAHNLGEIRQGESRYCTFSLVNNSNRVVSIVGVVSSCGCAVASPTATRIAPGDSTAVIAQFSSGASRGAQLSEVHVLYSAGRNRTPDRLVLTISASMVPDYEIHPLGLLFGPNTASVKSVTFRPNQLNPFVVESAHSTNRDFVVEVQQPQQNVNDWRIHVAYKPSSHGVLGGHLVVHTNSNAQPVARIPLTFSSERTIP